jgi:hypothetical protein
MKLLSKNIVLLLFLAFAAITHTESRDGFTANVSKEINETIDINHALDRVIGVLLQDYALNRVFREGVAREAAGLVDENGQALSDDEMDYRIGYLEAKRRILRTELQRPAKTLNQFLAQSGFLLAAIPGELINNWKHQALLLAPGVPEA